MPAFNYKQEYERYKKYYLSMEPVLQKPQNQAYTSIIFSFLAISLFGWYAIGPTMQTIFTLKREISDRTTVSQQMENKISALISAQAEYQNIQDAIPLVAAALPPYADPIGAVRNLQGLAADTGVTMSGISVPTVPLSPSTNTNPTGGSVTSVDVTVNVSGPYSNVKNFILGIKNLRRIMQITSMSFAPEDRVTTSPPLSASASATATASSTLQTPGTSVTVDLKLKVFYLTS